MWLKSFPFRPPRQIFKRLPIVTGGIWIGFLCVLAISIYGQLNVRQARALVNQAFEVLDAIQQLESSLLSAQSSLHTFFNDQDVLSLGVYQQNIESAQRSLDVLLSVTRDPTQQRSLQELKTKLEQRIQEQNSLLQQGLQPTPTERNPASLINQSFYTSDIQDLIIALEQEERVLLQQRRKAVDQQGALASGAMVLGVAIAALLFWRATQQRQQRQEVEVRLNQRLRAIELEQDLSHHLLTCRTSTEAHDILQSFLTYLLPDCRGVVYEINNSRDQMEPSVVFGKFMQIDSCSPRECWALRRGSVQLGHQTAFKIPCKLCRMLHPDGVPTEMMCLPLQAHEQTIGILHLTQVPDLQQTAMLTVAQQIALPLAVLHLQAELEYLSFHDASTGVYNRRFLDEMLSRAIASTQRRNHQLASGETIYGVGVIFMDIDHFKRFNSEFGHEVGDMVLRVLGDFLSEITRAGEDVPCRYGGEEFVLIMPGASEEMTLSKAEMIRTGIKQRPIPKGGSITVSMGVATYPQNGATAEEVLRAANVALLRAKAEGRDRVLLADS